MVTIRQQLEPLLREHGICRCAEAAGLSPSVLSEWLAGKRNRRMTDEQLMSLAMVVGKKLVITRRLENVGPEPESRREDSH